MGLAAADAIVAVSPAYALEMLTPEYGCGLQDFLRARADVVSGILNGIDTQQFSPSTDSALTVTYSAESLPSRGANKLALQTALGLPPDPDVPLLGMITRMDPQKGVDIALSGLRLAAEVPWQAVLLGTGIQYLEEEAAQLARDLPERVRAVARYDDALSRQIYAGADVLLMPSRYEPCGLAQMIAMRYGCLPVAHATGGLRDTIFDLDDPARSTGFLFENATSDSLSAALRRGLPAYADQTAWQVRQRFAMQQDFSWPRSAQAYFNLYLDLTQSHSA
jgi:starch synthase